MGSRANFDDIDGIFPWSLENNIPFDESEPISMAEVDIPFRADEPGHQNIGPGLLSDNFPRNYQATVAAPPFDFDAVFPQLQSNDSHGMTNAPFGNQPNGYLLNRGPGYQTGQSAAQLPQNLSYFSQTSLPWGSQVPNQVPFLHIPHTPRHLPSRVRQQPQSTQGRTRRHIGQSAQQPLLHYGQQYTQQHLFQYVRPQPQQLFPQSVQQPRTQAISAEGLKQKLKEPGTDEFKLLIETPEEAKQYKEVYLSLGDVDRKPREDIRGREQELIGRLYSAIRHFTHIEEGVVQVTESPAVGLEDLASGQAQKKRKRAGTKGQSDAAVLRQSPAELQMVCWELLVAILDAQEGKNKIPAWYTAKPHGYGKFESFDRRFEAVEEVLQNSKIMCKSLLDGDEWQARIAWNPIKEAHRKSSNKLINKERSVLLRAGATAIRKSQRSNNEHNDVHDDEVKADDSELPSKAIKKHPGTESLSDFDFALLPMNCALPGVHPPLPIWDNSLPVSNAGSSFTGADSSFPSAASWFKEPPASSEDPPSSYLDIPESSLGDLPSFKNSPPSPMDAVNTGMGESADDFFSAQAGFADVDWSNFFNDQAAAHQSEGA